MVIAARYVESDLMKDVSAHDTDVREGKAPLPPHNRHHGDRHHGDNHHDGKRKGDNFELVTNAQSGQRDFKSNRRGN